MAEVHALVTGPIKGRIPTPHKDIPSNFVNVTPDVLYFDTPEAASLVADAIEAEHHARRTYDDRQLRCDHRPVVGKRVACAAERRRGFRYDAHPRRCASGLGGRRQLDGTGI